jgi:hypothetical protein
MAAEPTPHPELGGKILDEWPQVCPVGPTEALTRSAYSKLNPDRITGGLYDKKELSRLILASECRVEY